MRLRTARRWLAAGLVVAASAWPLTGGAQQGPRTLFERGRVLEENGGTLKQAVALYEQVAAEARTDRPLAAQALLRAAECYEKLGDARASAVYERLVRDYADQTEAAAEARTRLRERGRSAPDQGDRAVWTGPGVDPFGTVSPDGRYISYVDWGGRGNLMLHDVATNTDRALTGNVRTYGELGEASWSAISRDGSHVAYGWRPNDTRRSEVRVAALRGTGVPASRVVRQSTNGESIRVFDWSPDGRWLAVLVERADHSSQIGVLAVDDGSLREIKTVAWRGAGKVLFSPDGRYLAYDLSINDTGTERHIFVMAADASRETAIFAEPSANVVMGWSPRGQLLFASNRGGSTSLWALPVSEGRAAGQARLLRAGIGTSWSLGLASSGTLYVFRDDNPRAIHVARVDLERGTLQPAGPHHLQILAGGSDGRPEFSPDGRQFVHKFCAAGRCGFAIRSMETGDVRRVQPALSGFWGFEWSDDGRFFVTDGTDLKGRRGTYLVDVETGALTLVAPFVDGGLNTLSPDRTTLYYRGRGGIVARDVVTGADRAVFVKQAAEHGLSFVLSPDGRSFATVEYGPGEAQALWIVPADGGEPKQLLRTSGLDGFRLQWTPDGRAVVVVKGGMGPTGDGKELLLIPLATGQPRTLKVDIGTWVFGDGNFRFSPDGSRIAFVTDLGKKGAEVWALENIF